MNVALDSVIRHIKVSVASDSLDTLNLVIAAAVADGHADKVIGMVQTHLRSRTSNIVTSGECDRLRNSVDNMDAWLENLE